MYKLTDRNDQTASEDKPSSLAKNFCEQIFIDSKIFVVKYFVQTHLFILLLNNFAERMTELKLF